MKASPIILMVLLVFLGVWLVLQPTLMRGHSDLTLRVGAMEIALERIEYSDLSPSGATYRVLSPAPMRGQTIHAQDIDEFVATRIDEWNARPAFERQLLGFFNITSWATFGFVVVGLVGQTAFFGRMLVQWIVSERSRISTVPVAFWWMSFIGGVCLFIYFVWRTDIVGVMGQSTGIVIYARNLRLISKQRQAQTPAPRPEPEGAPA